VSIVPGTTIRPPLEHLFMYPWCRPHNRIAALEAVIQPLHHGDDVYRVRKWNDQAPPGTPPRNQTSADFMYLNCSSRDVESIYDLRTQDAFGGTVIEPDAKAAFRALLELNTEDGYKAAYQFANQWLEAVAC
jgi:hypothetical protein